MEVSRHTQVRFVLIDQKVLVSPGITSRFREELEDRFPAASIDVMVSAATFMSISFQEEIPEHWTNAWMKREVEKIFTKYKDLTC